MLDTTLIARVPLGYADAMTVKYDDSLLKRMAASADNLVGYGSPNVTNIKLPMGAFLLQ
jgi:hypothetical protein